MFQKYLFGYVLWIFCWGDIAAIQKRQVNPNPPLDLHSLTQQATNNVFNKVGSSLPNVFGPISFAPMPPMQPFAPLSTGNTNQNSGNFNTGTGSGGNSSNNATASARETRQTPENDSSVIGQNASFVKSLPPSALPPANGSIEITIVTSTIFPTVNSSINDVLPAALERLNTPTVDQNETAVVPSNATNSTMKAVTTPVGNDSFIFVPTEAPTAETSPVLDRETTADAAHSNETLIITSDASHARLNETDAGVANENTGYLVRRPSEASPENPAVPNGPIPYVENITTVGIQNPPVPMVINTSSVIAGSPSANETALVPPSGNSIGQEQPSPVNPFLRNPSTSRRADNVIGTNGNSEATEGALAFRNHSDALNETTTVASFTLSSSTEAVTLESVTNTSLRNITISMAETSATAIPQFPTSTVPLELPVNASNGDGLTTESSISLTSASSLSANHSATADNSFSNTFLNASTTASSMQTTPNEAQLAENVTAQADDGTTPASEVSTDSMSAANIFLNENTTLGAGSVISNSTALPLELQNSTLEAVTTPVGNDSFISHQTEAPTAETSPALDRETTTDTAHSNDTLIMTTDVSHARLNETDADVSNENTGYLVRRPSEAAPGIPIVEPEEDSSIVGIRDTGIDETEDIAGSTGSPRTQQNAIEAIGLNNSMAPQNVSHETTSTARSTGELPELPSVFAAASSMNGLSLPDRDAIPGRVLAILKGTKGWDAEKTKELQRQFHPEKIINAHNATVVTVTDAPVTSESILIPEAPSAQDDASDVVHSVAVSKQTYVPEDPEDEKKFWSILQSPIVKKNRLGFPANVFSTLRDLPASSFSCLDVGQPGYYADQETQCQAFHRCDIDGNHYRYFCPPQTLYSQLTLVCDHWYNVNCEEQAKYADYINSRAYGFKEFKRYRGSRNIEARIKPILLQGDENREVFVPIPTSHVNNSDTNVLFL